MTYGKTEGVPLFTDGPLGGRCSDDDEGNFKLKRSQTLCCRIDRAFGRERPNRRSDGETVLGAFGPPRMGHGKVVSTFRYSAAGTRWDRFPTRRVGYAVEGPVGSIGVRGRTSWSVSVKSGVILVPRGLASCVVADPARVYHTSPR